VKTKVDGKEKIIRFGQQGASTAGKPKEGESDRMKAKRASFKARHSANIAKGPASAAYWANKVKWADGGSVKLNYAEGDSVRVQPQNAALGSIANFLKQSYAPQRTQQMQGMMEFLGVPAVARTVERMSYGQPITNVNKANVPLLPSDTAEAAMLVAPPLTSLAKRVGTNLVQTAPYVARDMMQSMANPMKSYVVKPEGGNRLAGSFEKSIEPMKIQGLPDLTGTGEIPLDPGPAAINKWLDTKLLKYMYNEMATPKDPVRALAEQGISHMRLGPVSASRKTSIGLQRERAGFPVEGMGQSATAKRWEAKADEQVEGMRAGNFLDNSMMRDRILAQNPWMSKVSPDTQVYSTNYHAGNELGFDHLVDELRNAIDPNSTLPANLRLKYTDLDKVTVPQAIERVAKINDWRAAQAKEAEKLGMMGNLTAAPRLQDPTTQLSFVEKPGMTWVDIPATTDKTANKLCTTIGKQAGWCTQGRDLAESYGSGNNRLTTLLDAEGRPHVQAMITQQSDELRRADFLGQLSEEQYDSVLKGDPQQAKIMYEEWASKNPPSLNIGELKPVGNTFSSARSQEYMKRDPDYQTKITDSVLKFLNSGEWGKVKDLDQYDIIDIQNPKSVQSVLSDVLPYHISQERAGIFNDAIDKNPNANRFMSKDQLKDFIGPVDLPDTSADGYAEGGSVAAYDPFQVDEVMNSIDAPRGYKEGGSVQGPDIEFTEDPEALRLYKYAMRQTTPNPEELASGVGAGINTRIGGGNFSAGFDMNRMTQGERDQMMRSLATNYNINLGDLNLNARVQKPLEAEDVYIGMLNGSIPLAAGRAMLGIQGIKTPQGSDVLGYSAGWSGKVGPGNLSANINLPKRGGKSAQVQYQIPFAEGGSVSAYDPDQIDAIANQFM
jgi:hypothetical protein